MRFYKPPSLKTQSDSGGLPHSLRSVLGATLGLISMGHSDAAAPSPGSLQDCTDVSSDLEAANTLLWYSNGLCLGLAIILIMLIALMMCFPGTLVKCVDGIGEMERRRWAEQRQAIDGAKDTGSPGNSRRQPRRYTRRQSTRSSSFVRKVLKKAEIHKDAHDKSQKSKKRISAQRLEKRLAARLAVKRLSPPPGNTISCPEIGTEETGIKIKSAW
jgi:hypothetical protein